jgi:hypothetical protein
MFISSRESESISMLSRDLTNYGYNNESLADTSFKGGKTIYNKVMSFRKAVGNNQVDANIIINTYGKNADNFITTSINRNVNQYFKTKYGIDISYDANELSPGFHDVGLIIKKLSNTGKQFTKDELDDISKFLYNSHLNAIKKSLENNDSRINKYINEIFVKNLSDAITSNSAKVSDIADDLNAITSLKAMRILLARPNISMESAIVEAKQETFNIIGTLLRRKNINLNKAQLETYLNDNVMPKGHADNIQKVEKYLERFENNMDNIYGVDPRVKNPSQTKKQTPPNMSSGSIKSQSTSNSNSNTGNNNQTTNTATNADVNNTAEKTSELTKSTEKVLGIIAGVVALVGIGSIAYAKFSDD